MDGWISEADAIAEDRPNLELKQNDSLQKPDHSIIVEEEEEFTVQEETVRPSSLEEVLADCLDSDPLIQDMKGLSNAGNCYMNRRVTVAEVLGERKDSGFDTEGRDSSNNIIDRWAVKGKSWLPVYRRAEDDVTKGVHTGSTCWKGPRYADSDIDSHVNFSESFHSYDYNLTTENIASDEYGISSNDMWGYGVTRTKMLSKSGISEFFVKNTLEEKGITCTSSAHGSNDVKKWNQDNTHGSGYPAIPSDAFITYKEKVPLSCSHTCSIVNNSLVSSSEGVVLRDWLRSSVSAVDKANKLDIFRQVLELTSFHHSRGVVLKDLRPSFFKLSESNKVEYFGGFIGNEISDNISNEDVFNSDNHRGNKRRVESTEKSKSTNFSRWKRPFFPGSESKTRDTLYYDDSNTSTNEMIKSQFCFTDSQAANKRDVKHLAYVNCKPGSAPCSSMSEQPDQQGNTMRDDTEEKWYASPDEPSKQNQMLSSNIYNLGVLLFELLGSFNSEKARRTAMFDLRHRILPPLFLSECPLETGLCLWLLHPEASSRPLISDILYSELVRNLKVLTTTEPTLSDPDEADADLLFDFLSSMKEMKKTKVSKLINDISFLEDDIKEIEKRNLEKVPTPTSSVFHEHSNFPGMVQVGSSSASQPKDVRLAMNLKKLETVYFSTRPPISPPTLAGNRSSTPVLSHRPSNSDSLGDFFDGLCKYGRYTKFELCRELRSGDFTSSSPNVVCSLGFDRDEDYFAAAGISKKIKIFDFQSLFGEYSSDIHYPVAEMLNNSKISCICWNPYLKNFMASTGYDGIVKLWDVGKAQDVSQYIGHQKRVWSVDFSHLDPTKFITGSDDYCVKLWSMNEKNCIGTIRNKANVCCVQFGGADIYKIGFGSADFQTYIYDLRATKVAWGVLSGHRKAVSYLKFLDHQTLVSASTDNTLRVWDFGKATSTSTSAITSSFPLTGHTNLKNFVGLTVSPDGYIVCGSETNEVFSYYRSMPMPIASYKFGYMDPISGKEMEEEDGSNSNSLFVSSVCWRGKSDMAVAANSSGRIKVLKMV